MSLTDTTAVIDADDRREDAYIAGAVTRLGAHTPTGPDSYSITYDAQEWANDMHVPAAPVSVASVMPEQWVSWDGVTVTLDPMRNKKWVYDGFTGHQESIERGKYFDKREVNAVIQMEQTDVPPSFHLFQPTLADFNSNSLYSEPQARGCLQLATAGHSGRYKRTTTNFGKLPVISQMKYDGLLYDKPTPDIERDIYESERTAGVRLYDPPSSVGDTR